MFKKCQLLLSGKKYPQVRANVANIVEKVKIFIWKCHPSNQIWHIYYLFAPPAMGRDSKALHHIYLMSTRTAMLLKTTVFPLIHRVSCCQIKRNCVNELIVVLRNFDKENEKETKSGIGNLGEFMVPLKSAAKFPCLPMSSCLLTLTFQYHWS